MTRKKYRFLFKLIKILNYLKMIVVLTNVLLFILYLKDVGNNNVTIIIVLSVMLILSLKIIQIIENNLMFKIINT